MKRLIYAPKVYIFIRSSNLDGKVFDVSADVVNGSVTQNCGDVSTAEFYLKNRYQKWIRDPSNMYKQIFLPMDMVTIWLQRIAGKPIQVFTGYLDEVPYYQGYSGDAYFSASCTLKKLAYTWFDPGLPFFQQWMMSTDGWTYDVSTGEAINPKYQITGQPITTAGPGTGQTASISDGGFAELLGRFMTEVAGWDYNDILISQLPTDIPQIAAKLYQSIELETEKDLANLTNFMNQAMGVTGWGGAQVSTTTTSGGTTVNQSKSVQLATTIAQAASTANVPPLLCLFAAYILSGLDAKRSVLPGRGVDNNWGYGLYSLQPPAKATDATGLGLQAIVPGNGSAIAASVNPYQIGMIEGYTSTQLLDAATSTKVFCDLLNKNQGGYVTAAKQGDVSSMMQWISAAIGRTLPTTPDPTTALTKAKQLATTSNVVVPTQSPSVGADTTSMSWTDSWIQSPPVTDNDRQIIQTYYSNAKPWLAGVFYQAKQVSGNLTISTIPNQPANSVIIKGTASDLKAFYNSLAYNTNYDLVQFQSAGSATTMAYGVPSNLSVVPSLTINSVIVVESKAPPQTSGSASNIFSSNFTATTPASSTATSTTTTAAASTTSSTSPGSSSPGGASFEQLAAFSANSAFAANFAFPADYLLATNLTGDRALMNDTSCLDAVKQFCAASLREFRSLPDGRFMAFYPDYFGARRQAYWSINNIEIIDFGIQLNDEALATHVYVIGDTFDGDGTIDDYDEISTRGVATISQAFMLNSFIEAYEPPVDAAGNYTTPSLGRLADSISFLQHYGARPHTEEQPIIRNTFYEFLMAWQRFMQLWASQFATTASFTFQPEVMAGGLIAFPDHGIQMYCDTVTHNFDYTGGFSTNATLSSPSLLPGSNVSGRQAKPGFALAGNTNTVGLTAGGS